MHFLTKQKSWKLSPPSAFHAFLRALPDFMPEDSVLYIETSGTPQDVKTFLNSRSLHGKRCLPGGSLFPRPDVFNLPLNTENMSALIELLNRLKRHGIPTHIHVYRGDELLLQWFDASASDPIFISMSVSEEKVISFCALLSCQYTRSAG